jgi:hypothetical protein
MADHGHLLETLRAAEQRLEEQEHEVIETKKFINLACKMAGLPIRYADQDFVTAKPTNTGVVRGDEYYGKPLASVVRLILESRDRSGAGPATINQIYDAMVEGCYQFETSNPENAKRGLRESLAKNSSMFHKLPTGKFGLTAWYPAIKSGRQENGHLNGNGSGAKSVNGNAAKRKPSPSKKAHTKDSAELAVAE